MKRTLLLVLTFVTTLLLAMPVFAQVQNEGLANSILAARKKEATLLAQYCWNSRVEIQTDGAVQDIRIDEVALDANGQPQRTLLNDTPSQLPGGFFRRAIEENKRKKLEKFMGGLSGLLDKYALPSAGSVIAYIVQAQIAPVTTPDNKTVLQVTGTNVVVPGDTFAMTVDGATMQTTRLQITTTYEGDPVNITATFKAMKGGPNHLQYATVSVPAKDVTVMIHNFDYVPNN